MLGDQVAFLFNQPLFRQGRIAQCITKAQNLKAECCEPEGDHE